MIQRKYDMSDISLSKFLDVLPAFTCKRATGNLWTICLGVNVLRLEWSETLSGVAYPEKSVPSISLEIFNFQKHHKLFL